MTRKRRTVFLSTVFIAIPLLVGNVILRPGRPRSSERINGDVRQATNAAYRDGLFQGKLAAARGAKPIPSVGRWNGEKDRSSFAAGYKEGYEQQEARKR
jgi:hypothetical protein